MAVLGLVIACCLLYTGTVNGAGYLSKRPRSSGLCYYEHIEDAHFSYDRHDCEGPKNWCTLNECWTTCGSKRRQSPINISTRKAKSRNIKRFVLENTHKRVPATIFNNGHAPDFNVAVDENNEENIILTNVPGRPSHKKYIFAQLHVHLGRKKGRGSEHAIDRKFYPMEAHMVFYDSKFDNIANAKPAKDGLVVIGVMLKVKNKHGDDDDDDGEEEEEDDDDDDERERDGDEKHKHKRVCKYRDFRYFLKKCYKGRGRCRVRFARTLSYIMEKYYKKVREHQHSHSPDPQHTVPKDLICGKPPSQETIEEKCIKKGSEHSDAISVSCGISPEDVLPYDQRFYTYRGSLTTPPCYETVQWIVFKCPIMVSQGAFEALRKVEDSHNEPLHTLGVRRPLQRNKRQRVYKNF